MSKGYPEYVPKRFADDSDEGGPPSPESIRPDRWPLSVRCRHVKKNGERCSRWAVRGGERCPSHSKKWAVKVTHPRKVQLAEVEKLARKLGGNPRIAEATRTRLLLAEGDAISTLEAVHTDTEASNRDRTQAASALLRASERVREGGDVTINNTVVAVDAGAKVRALLDAYAEAARTPSRRIIESAPESEDEPESAG